MERRGFYRSMRNDLVICRRPYFLPGPHFLWPLHEALEPLLGISWVLEEVRFDLGTAQVPFRHLLFTAQAVVYCRQPVNVLLNLRPL